MTDIIRLLPDNIANQIAAGEVVQRPASVVKELMENSVDAGAHTIRLIVKNGGKALIQVIDDGIGMSETDARMCFERHATSKIKKLDDLYAIHTLGFRGEAMASIAAVAQVELKTKRKDDEIGVLIHIENSEIQKHEPCSAPDGTSISVKNLFFNVPARRNFLKSNTVELRHITEEFVRVALAHPELSFSFISENEEVYHLRAGSLPQRIVGLFGKKYEEALVPLEENSEVLNIKGFIGKPEFARKSRGEQFLFANNRFIKSAYLHHALVSAFESLLPADSHPFYVIFLSLPPERIDINVHPTKTEIKFEDEKSIYAILRTAVKKSLSQYHISPSLSFEDESSFRPTQESRSSTSLRTGMMPEPPSREFNPSALRQKANKEEWEELYRVLSLATPEEKSDESNTESAEDENIELPDQQQKPALQLQHKYIITTLRSGLMIIHQQLAHERILFERYLEQMQESGAYSQRLLFPEMIELGSADALLMKEIIPEINSLGFQLEEFGKNTFVLNGIPIEMAGQKQDHILEKLLEEYKNSGQGTKMSQPEKLAFALATNTSIKIGRVLATEEMATLIDELFACKMPYYSPDGKPVLITIAGGELDKKFKKI